MYIIVYIFCISGLNPDGYFSRTGSDKPFLLDLKPVIFKYVRDISIYNLQCPHHIQATVSALNMLVYMYVQNLWCTLYTKSSHFINISIYSCLLCIWRRVIILINLYCSSLLFNIFFSTTKNKAFELNCSVKIITKLKNKIKLNSKLWKFGS